MKNNSVRSIAIIAVLLAIFCAVSFIIPFSRTSVFWIAFGFAAFAILFQLYILKTAFGKDGSVKSKFYGFPVARIGLYYLLAQLVISFIEMALSKVLPQWLVLAVNLLVVGAALLGCLFVETMREEISRQDEQLKQDVNRMRALQSLARTIASQCDDAGLKPVLDKLADDFRYSDPVTSEKTEAIEADMLKQLNEVQQAMVDMDTAAAGELCKKLRSCLAERNRVCAMSKQG